MKRTWRKTASTELEGNKKRPVQTGMLWAPPVVAIEHGYLVFNAATRIKKVTGSGLLPDFIDLAEADDASIFKYAKRWGALALDENGWPIQRFPEPHRRVDEFEVYQREPVSTWKFVARRFRAIRNLGASLNNGKPGLEQDWLDLAPVGYLTDFMKPWKVGMDVIHTELQAAMRELIERYRVSTRFWWNKAVHQWQIDLDAGGNSNLPGLLLINTMLEVADKDGFAICSACHRSYLPRRRPDPTRRNYCERDDCCRQAAWRDSKRDQRLRHRETRAAKKRNAKKRG